MTEFASQSEAVHERFLAFEDEYDAFELTADGVPIWERVRFQVNRQIMQEAGIIGLARDSQPTSLSRWIRRLAGFGSAVTTKNPFTADEGTLLFWGHPRRKRLGDGWWWDLYCDPIHANLDFDSYHIEEPYLGIHRKPARTPRLGYLDVITGGDRAARILDRPRVSIDPSLARTLDRMEAALQETFGTAINLHSVVTEILRERRFRKPLYDRLLDRVAPDAVGIVQSYGKETFVEACKERNIPTIELQHGALSRYHYGYSYPGERSKSTFPDHFFAFGDHFCGLADYPIPESQVHSVGYPYLERELAARPDATSGETVLFLSQGTIGKSLSRLAVTLSEELTSEHEIVYKLHPTEQNRWREEYPWLLESDIRIVEGDKPSLYDLFERAFAQVGVYSTTLYEGLAFGLATYLLNIDRIEFVRDIVDAGWATVVESAAELTAELASPNRPTIDKRALFESDALQNIDRLLTDIARTGKTTG